ncbi:MAG TPA: DUF4214 domain-containing protein [Azospirillaceae bacterium]|nr:DUF4214 domain-containing protein [Azospirillaceae bacterium]
MTIQSDLQKLYIAFFNRPADPGGLAWWEQRVSEAGGNLAAVVNAFSAAPEYKALYDGLSNAQVVNQLYRNLFGRDAEPAGLDFWTGALEGGVVNVGNIAYTMTNGAQGDDAKVIANKAKVAEAFTAALDTTTEVLSYSGPAAAVNGRALLSQVDATAASVDAALAAIPDRIKEIRGPQDWVSQTVTLTGDVDAISLDPGTAFLHLKVLQDSTVSSIPGDSLQMLYVTGPGALTVTSVGASVRSVSAFQAEDAITIDLTMTSPATMLGGWGDDVLTGGAGADFIAGAAGNDTLSGDAGADTYGFATSGALNGTDTITLVAGTGGDILDFGPFLNQGSVEQHGATGTAIHAFTSADKGDVNITNKVALYSDAAEANIDNPNEIAELINGTGDAFRLTAGGKAVLITGDAGGANDEANIWFVHDWDGNGNIAVNEVSLVGVTSSAFDLDTLLTSNFLFGHVTGDV